MKNFAIFLSIIFTLGMVYYMGYSHGSQVIYKELSYELAKQASEYENKLTQAKTTAQKISQDYLKARDNIDRLHSDNLALLDRLRKSEHSSTKEVAADTSARCPVTGTAITKIPVGMAEDITELSRQADIAAEYARKCYEWIQTLNTSTSK